MFKSVKFYSRCLSFTLTLCEIKIEISQFFFLMKNLNYFTSFFPFISIRIRRSKNLVRKKKIHIHYVKLNQVSKPGRVNMIYYLPTKDNEPIDFLINPSEQ